jgi:translation elongation factor P/translation initiation factor 5A
MEGRMSKVQKVTESKLERDVRAGRYQVEDREGDWVVLMDCDTFRTWTAKVVH